MHHDEGDSRREDTTALASIIDKGKTILIEDNDSDNDDQVAPIDVPADAGDVLALEPTGIYIATKASGIDYLWPLLSLLRQPCM